MRSRTQAYGVWQTISTWPRFQRAAFLTFLPPIVSCMGTMAILALTVKASRLFTDYATNIPILLLSALGCGLYISVKRFTFLSWGPTVLLFVFQFCFMAIARPPSEWVYALPSYLYTVGTPVFALIGTIRLSKEVSFP